MSATCGYCNRVMSPANEGCVPVPVNGVEQIRFGEELSDWGAESNGRCRNCNVAPGGLHHAGCDVERCPICGGQRISCAHSEP
jgi:hypothetical protein